MCDVLALYDQKASDEEIKTTRDQVTTQFKVMV